MPFEFQKFSSDKELAAAAAREWLQHLQSWAASSGNVSYTAALSGGRIAKTFFSEIVLQAKALPDARRKALERIEFFWADERCVPPADPECNYAIARQLLFEPLRISEARIHRLRGEDPPDVAARKAVKEITAIAPIAGGQPVLDMIFLGMGEDGHVASLFPGEAEPLMDDPAIYRAVVAVKPPPRRLTMGYGVLTAAKEVWVLVSGPGKEKALKDSLSVEGKTPMARVLQRRPAARVFSDVAPQK